MNESGITYKDCRLVVLDDSHIEYSDDYQNQAVGKVLKDELVDRTIRRFVYWIDKNGNPVDPVGCKGEDLQILGQHLYNLLFTSKREKHPKTDQEISVRFCFENALKNFEQDRRNNEQLRLRVILTFHQKADELAALPWEFIHVPWQPESFFLAGKKTELILTRCVPEAGDPNVPLDPGERPLKLLIVRSAPAGIGTVEAEDAINYIKSLHKEGVIEVEDLDNPTYAQLREKVEARKPHIFHFIGHGRADPFEMPGLALQREQKEIEEDQALLGARNRHEVSKLAWAGSAIFVELFKNCPPRLVFLQACKGAASGYRFHSTARDLIKAKIPAVVAMQFEITNEDANIFAQKFYQHLSAGRSVDEAVSEGRWELGSSSLNRGAWNDRGFGTPVIYLQARGALISPRAGEAVPVEKKADDTLRSTKVACPHSGCTGWVIPGANWCTGCKGKLTVCPKCRGISTPGFCPNCGPVADDTSSAVSAARQVEPSFSHLQPGTPSTRESLQAPVEPASTKSTHVDVRARLTQ